MKEYNVNIQFSGWYSVRICAASEEEAEEYAMEMFDEDDFGDAYNVVAENVFID